MASFLALTNGIPRIINVVGVGAPYDAYSTLVSTLAQGSAFTLPSGQTYNVGNNELLVMIDGIVQVSGLDYTESSTTTLNFQKTLAVGQTIQIRR